MSVNTTFRCGTYNRLIVTGSSVTGLMSLLQMFRHL